MNKTITLTLLISSFATLYAQSPNDYRNSYQKAQQMERNFLLEERSNKSSVKRNTLRNISLTDIRSLEQKKRTMQVTRRDQLKTKW